MELGVFKLLVLARLLHLSLSKGQLAFAQFHLLFETHFLELQLFADQCQLLC
jgi:hypothetical protein